MDHKNKRTQAHGLQSLSAPVSVRHAGVEAYLYVVDNIGAHGKDWLRPRTSYRVEIFPVNEAGALHPGTFRESALPIDILGPAITTTAKAYGFRPVALVRHRISSTINHGRRLGANSFLRARVTALNSPVVFFSRLAQALDRSTPTQDHPPTAFERFRSLAVRGARGCAFYALAVGSDGLNSARTHSRAIRETTSFLTHFTSNFKQNGLDRLVSTWKAGWLRVIQPPDGGTASVKQFSRAVKVARLHEERPTSFRGNAASRQIRLLIEWFTSFAAHSRRKHSTGIVTPFPQGRDDNR